MDSRCPIPTNATAVQQLPEAADNSGSSPFAGSGLGRRRGNRRVRHFPRNRATGPSTPFGNCSSANWSVSRISRFSLASSAFRVAVRAA